MSNDSFKNYMNGMFRNPKSSNPEHQGSPGYRRRTPPGSKWWGPASKRTHTGTDAMPPAHVRLLQGHNPFRNFNRK